MADDNSAGAGAVDPGLQKDIPPDRKANLAAVLHPPASADDPAGIEVAGAVFSVWVTPDHELHMSVKLGGAAAWLRQADGTVPLLLTDEAGTLLAADVRPSDPPSDEDTDLPRGEVISLERRRAGRRTPPANL